MGSSHRMNNQLGWDKQEVPQTQSGTACLRLTTPITSGFGESPTLTGRSLCNCVAGTTCKSMLANPQINLNLTVQGLG
jgi:hypothetical protein